jgi:hypothetical protein
MDDVIETSNHFINGLGRHCKLTVAYCRLPVANFRLQIANFQFVNSRNIHCPASTLLEKALKKPELVQMRSSFKIADRQLTIGNRKSPELARVPFDNIVTNQQSHN